MRAKIINDIVRIGDYNLYLEIGVMDTARNFDKVNAICKVGVDPALTAPFVLPFTSDEFFDINTDMYDIVFIDGLHTYEQSRRDFHNALEVCTGAIILHDCWPSCRDSVEPCKPSNGFPWCGEVWRTWAEIREACDCVCVDIDHGVGIVLASRANPLPRLEVTYDEYKADDTGIISLDEWDMIVEGFLNETL